MAKVKTTNRVLSKHRRTPKVTNLLKQPFKRPFRALTDFEAKLMKSTRKKKFERVDKPSTLKAQKKEIKQLQTQLAADMFFDEEGPYTQAQLNEFNRASRP